MPYGVVLLADRPTHDRLAALARAVGGAAEPIMTLGERAPAHVSVVHFDGDPAGVAERVARHPVRRVTVKIAGLLYVAVPPGDYYTPPGGTYFGLEIVRRPDLDALHREVLGWVRAAGATPLGAVDADFRPHFTLGVVAGRPVLPDLAEVPAGTVEVALAFGELGPNGTFPALAHPGS